MGIDRKLLSTTTSSTMTAANFQPTGLPAIDDNVYTNNFNFTLDTNFTCALISNAANAATGAVATGGTTGMLFTTTTSVVLNFNIENISNGNTSGFLRLLFPSSSSTVWTGVPFGAGSYSVATSGSSSGTIVVNTLALNNTLIAVNAVGGTPTSNVVVNLPPTQNIQLLNSTSGTTMITIVGDVDSTINNFIQGTGKTININGNVNAATGTIPLGGTNIYLIDKLDMSTGTTYPIISTSQIALNDPNTAVMKIKFADNISRSLSIASDSPPEDKVEFNYVYDFGDKTGTSHKPPKEDVAKGVQVGQEIGELDLVVDPTLLNAAIAQAVQDIGNVVNAVAFIEEFKNSSDPTAIRMRNPATPGEVAAIVAAEINGEP